MADREQIERDIHNLIHKALRWDEEREAIKRLAVAIAGPFWDSEKAAERERAWKAGYESARPQADRAAIEREVRKRVAEELRDWNDRGTIMTLREACDRIERGEPLR